VVHHAAPILLVWKLSRHRELSHAGEGTAEIIGGFRRGQPGCLDANRANYRVQIIRVQPPAAQASPPNRSLPGDRAGLRVGGGIEDSGLAEVSTK
jgi:hypothetical protein